MLAEYKINPFPSAARPALKVPGLLEPIASCLGAKGEVTPWTRHMSPRNSKDVSCIPN